MAVADFLVLVSGYVYKVVLNSVQHASVFKWLSVQVVEHLGDTTGSSVYVLKRVSFGRKECTKELKLDCAYCLDQTIASFSQLGLISDPLIVSKFHNETHDRKGQ